MAHIATATTRPAPPASAAPTAWIRLGDLGAEERAAFPDEPFAVRHDLLTHPLLSLEGILELVDRLPDRHVDWHLGDVPLDKTGRLPKPPADPRVLLREIETVGAWLGIDKAQGDPACGALVRECVAEVARAFPGRLDHLHDMEGNIFVSSPGARKPVHMDPEHNFLLQIQGTKTVHLWDARDPALVSERLLEEFATTTDWAGVPVQVGDQPPTRSFQLEPGTGVYFPVHWPHAVENGSERACISLSVTFRSAQSKRNETLRQCNAKLRRRGLEPRPPGTSGLADSAKIVAMGVGRRLRRLLGRTD